MLNEKPRQLHLMLGKGAVEPFAALQLSHFNKKFPGEHIALVRPENRAEIEATGMFSEVHALDLTYIQRSSFSPLLGDEVAFHNFHQVLKPLTEQKWSRLFNLRGTSVDTALSEIFSTQAVVGSCARGSERRCQDAPLKLLSLLDQWGMNHPVLVQWITSKTFGQLDWTATEVALQKVIDIKNQKTANPLKNLLVGVNREFMLQEHTEQLAVLEQCFTVIDLTHESTMMPFLVDLVIDQSGGPWNLQLNLNHIDADSLSEILPEAISRSLRKWACLSFLFDYLGNARAALASEKIIARYDRDGLQQFLINQVMALKSFARLLLDGLRKPGSDLHGSLEGYWNANPDIITFACAIELSLHASISPLLRNEQDILAIKRRMRSLNQFYERLHRATALEIPKTDLELTL